MALRPWIVCGALSAVLLAGCGGSAPRSTTPAVLSHVFSRVLTYGELSGFGPHGGLAGSSASNWVAKAPISEAEKVREAVRLTRLGFVSGLRESLSPVRGGPAEGLSIVEQFQTPDAALTELALQSRLTQASGHIATFAVPAIPGARGFAVQGPPSSGVDVMFADGAYFYALSTGWPTGYSAAPSRAEVIAAAQHLYGRVHV